ncbi:LiaF domain-containing protein [Bernardetia sp. MNP-M8]|uniref:LiaF domain-containing protein n=1 Tax=Bernardetia sp. MNP-M8 TaxID=3127470 RepID=UPI0030CE4259
MKTTYGLPAKREELIDVLNTAFAEQNLDDDEYENRVKEALNAKCIEELEVIVFDFPKEIKNKLFPNKNISQQKSDFPPAAFSSSSEKSSHSSSEFSSSSQRSSDSEFSSSSSRMTHSTSEFSSSKTTTHLGSELSNFFPARSVKAIFTTDKELVPVLTEQSVHFQAVFGTQKIDFRNCRFEGQRFRIDVDSIFSNTTLDLRNQDLAGKHIDIFIKGALNEIKIYIPNGGTVQKNTNLILGEYSIKDKKNGFMSQVNKFLGNEQTENKAIAFTITLHGNTFMGSVKVIY